MKASVAEIAELVQGKVLGDKTVEITGFNSIRQALPGDLTFVADSRYASYLERTEATAVLVPRNITHPARTLIQVANPYAAFAAVLTRFRPSATHHPEGIHPSAVVGENVRIGENVALGAHATVADKAEIGDGATLYAGCYVGHGAKIGADCLLYPNVVIRENVTLGARCIVHGGAVIGADGFGFLPAQQGHQKIPQIGTVVIEDDVEIGANTTIDRATFGQTLIRRGTKIDNLVQIGHNVETGEHCIICGNAGISGSAILGNRVTIAAGAGVAGHIEVGDNVTVAALSGVTKSVPAGRVVSGFPAIDHDREKLIKAGTRMLPEALRRIRTLERRLAELEGKLDGTAEDNS